GGDGANLAVLLPHAVRSALHDLDHDLVRVELAHARLLDERIGFEPRARRGYVEEWQRVLRANSGDRENARFAHMRRAGHGDDVDPEAERSRGDVAQASVVRDEGFELSAPRRTQGRRSQKYGEGQGDLEPERRRPIERYAQAQRDPP